MQSQQQDWSGEYKNTIPTALELNQSIYANFSVYTTWPELANKLKKKLETILLQVRFELVNLKKAEQPAPALHVRQMDLPFV